jgi:hypothetical protein
MRLARFAFLQPGERSSVAAPMMPTLRLRPEATTPVDGLAAMSGVYVMWVAGLI